MLVAIIFHLNMRWKWVKWIYIQQFLQLIHLDLLWSFLWVLSLRTYQLFQVIHLQFCNFHRGREIFQRQLCLLNQVQAPLHPRGMTCGSRLLQRHGIPPIIIPLIWPIFGNLVLLVVILKYPLHPHMFWQKMPLCYPHWQRLVSLMPGNSGWFSLLRWWLSPPSDSLCGWGSSTLGKWMGRSL